jgi:hypothetical protein
MTTMKMAMISLLASACIPAQSSRGVLNLDQSRRTVREEPDQAAREVTRLFATRGYALVDQTMTRFGHRLEFRGRRDEAIVHTAEYASGFYAWIADERMASTVTIVGWPIVAGYPACHLIDATLECSTSGDDHMRGYEEASVIYGVFSELAVEGLVATPPVAMR